MKVYSEVAIEFWRSRSEFAKCWLDETLVRGAEGVRLWFILSLTMTHVPSRLLHDKLITAYNFNFSNLHRNEQRSDTENRPFLIPLSSSPAGQGTKILADPLMPQFALSAPRPMHTSLSLYGHK